MSRILVIGANGQIGSELTDALAHVHGEANVIAADIVHPRHPHRVQFVCLDVLDCAKTRGDCRSPFHRRRLPAGRRAVRERRGRPARHLDAQRQRAPQRARARAGEKNRPRLLAVLDSGIRSAQPVGRDSAVGDHGSDDDLRRQQAGRRAPVRVLLREIRGRRAQHPLPRRDRLSDPGGRRNDRLRDCDIPGSETTRALSDASWRTTRPCR